MHFRAHAYFLLSLPPIEEPLRPLPDGLVRLSENGHYVRTCCLMGVHRHQLVATISPIDVAATNVLEPCAPASFEHDAGRRELTDIDGSISSTNVVILTSHSNSLPSHLRPARTFQQQKQSWSAAIVPPSSPEVNLRQVDLPLRLLPALTVCSCSVSYTSRAQKHCT